MNSTFILPVIVFAFTMSITPGPNNIMLTASGANFGFRKTVPHILGILIGIAIMNILSSLGLSRLFSTFPNVQAALKYIGVVYLLFLAYKIATSGGIKNSTAVSKPLSFIQGMLFQALNPKAVIMTITAVSVYSLEGEKYYSSILYIVLIFIVVGALSISTWALFGTLLKKLLNNIKYLRIFNYTMGAMCGLSALLIL